MAVGGALVTKLKPKETRITAVITRANGEVIDLGTIAYKHRNPFIQLAYNIGKLFRRRTT